MINVRLATHQAADPLLYQVLASYKFLDCGSVCTSCYGEILRITGDSMAVVTRELHQSAREKEGS